MAESAKFLDYIRNFDTEKVKVNEIIIVSVFLFGDKVGFVDLQVDCQFKNSKYEEIKIPGYVFLRGKSVAVLIIVNKSHIIVTE